MIQRKIDQYFEHFYQTEKKALLVAGARQTGKTFSIRNFGNTHFDSVVEINFIEKENSAPISYKIDLSGLR